MLEEEPGSVYSRGRARRVAFYISEGLGYFSVTQCRPLVDGWVYTSGEGLRSLEARARSSGYLLPDACDWLDGLKILNETLTCPRAILN